MVSHDPGRGGSIDESGSDGSTVSRRRVLGAMGASGVGLFSGYVGKGGAVRGSSGDWPQLSGQELHILTEQSADPFREFWQRIAQDFEEETGAFVRIEYTGFGQGIRERITQLLQAGAPPDLSNVNVDQVATWSSQGLMGDTTEWAEFMTDQYGEFNDFTRITVDGRDQWYPIQAQHMMNWHRSDLLEETPTTWETQLQETQSVDDPDGVRGISMIMGRTACSGNEVWSYAWQNDCQVVDWVDGQIQVVMNEGENMQRWVELLNHFDELYQYSYPNTDMDCGGAVNALASSNGAQVAFVGSRPKDAVENREFGEAVRPARPPRNTTNQDEDKVWTSIQGFGTFAESNVEAANTFMRFMSQPEYLYDFYSVADPMMSAPTISEITEDPEFQSQIRDSLPGHWTDDDFLLWEVDNYVPLSFNTDPINPYGGLIDNSLLQHDLKFDVLVDDVDPETAVENRASEISALIEENRGEIEG